MADTTESPQPVLELRDVSLAFRQRGAEPVHVAQQINLTVFPGETVALIGESGSGKSSLARIALGLLKPDAGEVRLLGRTINALPAAALRQARVAAQPVFQDSGAAFNPRRTVMNIMAQATPEHDLSEAALRDRIVALLEQVGLKPGEDYMARYPHELSGGQRQRLAIARAINMEPALIIADEPLSGADVSIRGQILNLMIDLRESRNLAYLFITHDLTIARAFAHRVAVMYRGQLVEQGLAEAVLGNPGHAYTRKLVAAHLGGEELFRATQAS